ncbi:cation diffusion facilitator family transporter [Candidatus Neomarinimicrobiota bacterium]
MTLTELIMKVFSGREPPSDKLAERTRIGRLEAWVSMVVNGVLFVLKLILGLMINSISLIADAIHTVSDVATSIVVLYGFKMSGKPADKEHPFGHGRIEYIATLIIAIMLGVVGFEFIKSAVGRLMHPVPITAGWGILVAVFLTILVKAWLGHFSLELGRMIDSSALRADAWHHSSDAISSVLVLAAIWGSHLGYPALDGVGGILVGAYLIFSGIMIAKDAIDPLIGEPPSQELIGRIRHLCRTVPKVYDAHDIVVHNYGQYKFIGLHVEVDRDLTTEEAHDVAEEVAGLMLKELGSYATVHVDPIDRENEDVQVIKALLERLLPQLDSITGYHDLRVVRTAQHYSILFDMELAPDTTEGRRAQVRRWLTNQIIGVFPEAKVEINISPLHTYR